MAKASRGEIYRASVGKSVNRSVFSGKISGMAGTPCVILALGIWIFGNIKLLRI